MGEQRRAFRFRLPWSVAPAAQAQPQTATQAEKNTLHPAGVAPAQDSPETKTDGRAAPLPPSSTRAGTTSRTSSQSAQKRQVVPPSRALPASLSQTVPKEQVVSQPNVRERVGKQAQQETKSPSCNSPQPATSKDPTTGPSKAPKSPLELGQEAKQPPFMQNRDNTKISESQNKQGKQEIPPSSSQMPQIEKNTASEPVKVLEALEGSNLEENKVMAPDVSIPKPKFKLQSSPETFGTASKEPAEITKGAHHGEQKGAVFTKTRVPGSKAEIDEQQLNLSNDQNQDLKEEDFERKEILEVSQSSEHNTEGVNPDHEKVRRYNHKCAITKEKAPSRKEISEDLSKVPHKLDARHGMHQEHDMQQLSIITLTGENTGATMHLSTEPLERERPIHIHRGYKPNPKESVDTRTDGEESSRGSQSRETNSGEELGTKLYLSNNSQGINNSLVFHSSVTDRNPGVHVVYSRKAVDQVKSHDERESLETRKAKVSSIPAERLTYVPNIKRRCLRGLMMESSDSSPENPRRHGCRVGCSQENREDSVDVL